MLRSPFVPAVTATALLCQSAGAVVIVFVHDQSADQIIRLVDRNADGDYNDAGETVRFYGNTAGLPALTLPLSVTVWTCTADLAEPFGVLDLADVQAFIAAFTAGCP